MINHAVSQLFDKFQNDLTIGNFTDSYGKMYHQLHKKAMIKVDKVMPKNMKPGDKIAL